MDRARYSLIGHDGIRLWNPLDEPAAFALADAIPLGEDGRAIDVGCGRATLLLRMLERSGARGVGVDLEGRALRLARDDAQGRVPAERLDLREESFDPSHFEARSFDVALCIGSTHAAGGLHGTLQAFRRLLVAGGTLLVGEGHWLRAPDPGYLAVLGAKPDELTDDEGNRREADRSGFDVLRVEPASRDAFDRYEERYAGNIDRFVAAHPDDPDADAFRGRIGRWRDAYRRWGRTTLGFSLYLLRSRG